MQGIINYLHSFFSLFFPQLCASCNQNLLANEEEICTACLYSLPYTNFHEDENNRMAKQLWGRVAFSGAACLFYFRKGSGVQNLIHQLKYNNRPLIGNKTGELLGSRLRNSGAFKTADVIIPVPLHPHREKKRGYNQSAHFACGLADGMHLPVLSKNLVRHLVTDTQTRKSRFNRYENMKDVFKITDPASLEGKHIVLADDVLTTGATVEACANELLKVPGTRISIATIAFAE